MFNKHFKPGQRVLIHLTNPADGDDRLENISASCLAVDNGVLTLTLPYEIDASAFSENAKMSVISESLGLGLKAQTCFLCQQTNTSIQLRFDGDLRFFQKRPTARLNLPIGIRYSRLTGSLGVIRQQWQQHIHKLANTPPEVIPQLPCGMVNLSSGGIRLGFRNAVDKAQLCMLLLQVEPETPPICTMAEVVWTHSKGKDTSCTAGLQFMAIMAEDQKRLEKFIRTCQLKVQNKKNSTQNTVK